MSGEYKSVVLTKLITKPELAKSGKIMKCQASIDGGDPIELAFFPDKAADHIEGATIRAQFRDASGNFPASWLSSGKAKFGGKSGGSGSYSPKKNEAAIAAQCALKCAVEYAKQLTDCAPEDVIDVASRFLKWIKDNSKE